LDLPSFDLNDPDWHDASATIRAINAEKLLSQKPTELVRLAVKGMLPKNSLGRQMLTKLKIYAGSKHPHEAQQPVSLEKS
jgi:large subunit ribosomal protein L13